jgi:hypothetical protein
MSDASAAGGSHEDWSPERIAAERRRIMRQTWVILAVIAILLFGLMGGRYGGIEGTSGRTYSIVDSGRRPGTDWGGLYVKYLSTAEDEGGRDREFADLAQSLTEFAERDGDDRIEVAAARRLFQFGSLYMDQTVATRYRRVQGEWRKE